MRLQDGRHKGNINMPMPTMNELSQVYGNWNPEAYLQGRNQVDLATQYQQGANEGQVLDNRSKDLSNIFNEQANPLRVQGLGLDNSGKQLTQEGQGFDNRVKSVNANLAEGTAQFKLNQAQRDELKSMKESDIVMGELQAREMMMSPDENVRKQGEQLDSFTKFARDARRTQENKMEETKYKEQQATGRAVEGFANAREVARIGADSRLAVKNAGGGAKVKPPTTSTAAWVQALQQELSNGTITREQYLESIAQMVNAELAAKAGKNAQGVTTQMSPGGDLNIVNKPAAPSVAPPNKQPAQKAPSMTLEQYKAAPSGTVYTAPDGSIRTKP